jgi:hypothetical protein
LLHCVCHWTNFEELSFNNRCRCCVIVIGSLKHCSCITAFPQSAFVLISAFFHRWNTWCFKSEDLAIRQILKCKTSFPIVWRNVNIVIGVIQIGQKKKKKNMSSFHIYLLVQDVNYHSFQNIHCLYMFKEYILLNMFVVSVDIKSIHVVNWIITNDYLILSNVMIVKVDLEEHEI